MMESTSRTVVAVDGSRIVGFARALCDDVSNGYISMVGVAADKRGQGIGCELVRQLIGEDVGITITCWDTRALILKLLLGSGATALGSVISCLLNFKLTHYPQVGLFD